MLGLRNMPLSYQRTSYLKLKRWIVVTTKREPPVSRWIRVKGGVTRKEILFL